MKLIPSQKDIDHLLAQNVQMPEGGFDIPDTDYQAEYERLRHHPTHRHESEDDLKARVDYSVIWKFCGVQQNGTQRGVDLSNAQRMESMTRQLVQVTDSHLPNAVAAITTAVEASIETLQKSAERESAKATTLQATILARVDSIRSASLTNHGEVVKLSVVHHEEAMQVMKLVGKWIAAVLLFATLAMVLALESHAQIDVIKFQDSSGTTLGVAAAPFTLKVASGCTWSRSGSIWTIGCSTGTITNNPGTPSSSVQYNCSGAFCGIPEVHLGAVLIDQGPGVPPAFADPLVQGLVAAGASVAAVNPVYVGGVDGSGNSKGLVLDSSGRPTVNVNGTLQVQSNSANIATESTLSTLNAKVPALGQALAAASVPVILPSATITTLTPPAAITNFANETGGNLAAIKTDVDKIPSQGQALSAASMPVVLPATQITTLTPPAAITNFANETGGNLAAIKTDVDKIPAQGQALAAASMPVVLTAAQIATLTPLSTLTANQGGAPWSQNVTQLGGTAIDTNSGNKSAGTQRMVIATDQPNLTTPLNVEAAQVAEASTTNSALESNLQSAATTNATSVKASSGNLYGYEVINTTTTTYYLRLYNLAAAPTCSSATGFVRSIAIGGAAAAGQTGGIVRDLNVPVGFSTGIAYCLTGGGSSTDNTSAATGVYISLKYK